MHGFVGPINLMAAGNGDFQRLVFASGRMDLLLLALRRGDRIGASGAGEQSAGQSGCDQFLQIVTGKGRIVIGATRLRLAPGDAVVIPAGMRYTLSNTGKKRLRFYALRTHGVPAGGRRRALAGPAAQAEAASDRAARQEMISEGAPIAGGAP